MEQRHAERLANARARLFLRSGGGGNYSLRVFYGALASQIPVGVGPSPSGTAHTDGARIVFDPSFLERLSDGELQFVLLHELEHIVRFHVPRMVSGGFDARTWNIATDAHINALLREEGFPVPSSDDSFGGPIFLPWVSPNCGESEEETYRKLLENEEFAKQVGGSNLDGDLQPGDGTPSADQPGKQGGSPVEAAAGAANEAARRAVEDAIRQAAAAASSIAGSLPAHIEEQLREMDTIRVPYESVLRRVVSQNLRSRRTWARPNRRGLPAPGKGRDGMTVGVVLDTSGSMDSEVLGNCLRVIREITESHNAEIVLWQCDTEVSGPFRYTASNLPKKWEIFGRGGTVMSAAAKAVAQTRGVPLTLWFTDGEWFEQVNLPSNTKNYLVLIGGESIPSGNWCGVIRTAPKK